VTIGMGVFLIIVGVLCVSIALHPFITYPLSLVVLKRWRSRPLPPAAAGSDEPLEIALLMCAYNEERVIAAKAENLRALQQEYPGLQVFIYVDCASDRTAELLAPYQDHFRVHVASERKGKTHGMNLLMSQVQSPIVVFTDANVMIDREVPRRLQRYFADPEIGCVCGHLTYTNAGDSVTAASGSLYWRLDEWIKRLETETGSAVGADGSLFAIRKSLHRAPPDDLIDDFYVSMMIWSAGRRIVQAQDVTVFEESIPSQREEFARKVRIACQAFNAHLALWPSIRRMDAFSIYKYLSHKWLRWLVIYFLIAGGVSIELGLALAGHAAFAAALGGGALLFALIGCLGWSRQITQLWDILTAFAGTGLGVFKSFRGHRYQTWTPATSIRK
jgi:cellulose synthase/poly-beta-1,6-N-acetylglucosamine synthase-like glycosyltransferase